MESKHYPFFKLTLDEKFPRLLVTRRPEIKKDNQAIYGAFLPSGMVRRMLDLLQRLFRLRPCELEIKGDFDAPCPEYFLHRCLAPCVAAICSRETYLETVEIVHLILSNQFEIALRKIDSQIESLSENLEFERAAEWRDARSIVEEIQTNAKWQIFASAMNDVITIDKQNDAARINLTTLRRGKSVGNLHFKIESEKSEREIVRDFIEEFYRFYVPKQIFAPFDFPERKNLENKLNAEFGSKTKIVARVPEKLPPSILKTKKIAALHVKMRIDKQQIEKEILCKKLQEIFDLRNAPRRVECFDVAHLAGREIVASRVVAVDGVLQREENLVWEFENLSETAALAAAVEERLRLLPLKKELPDLFLIDGGKAQVNAVAKILNKFSMKGAPIVGAVKPPRLHNRISHFLTDKNSRVEFEKNSAAMNFLQTLRDAAHNLANETHRDLHSLAQIFKNNETAPQVRYLLVPTRFAEPDGNADDLSPIRSITQSKEIILKTKSKKGKF